MPPFAFRQIARQRRFDRIQHLIAATVHCPLFCSNVLHRATRSTKRKLVLRLIDATSNVDDADCAVRAAVESGAVDERRYASYVKLFTEIS